MPAAQYWSTFYIVVSNIGTLSTTCFQPFGSCSGPCLQFSSSRVWFGSCLGPVQCSGLSFTLTTMRVAHGHGKGGRSGKQGQTVVFAFFVLFLSYK